MSKTAVTVAVVVLVVGALVLIAHSLNLPALLIKMHGG
jgi:hypothetical protein